MFCYRIESALTAFPFCCCFGTRSAVSVGAVVAVIIIIAVILAIAGALVAMAIKRKRGEEAS